MFSQRSSLKRWISRSVKYLLVALLEVDHLAQLVGTHLPHEVLLAGGLRAESDQLVARHALDAVGLNRVARLLLQNVVQTLLARLMQQIR